ncbi:MAG: FG-GAP repeat domain-containing protein [Thermoplasmatota archaeon]
MTVPVSANTTFVQNGKTVSFSDVSGNEWWVQAHLTGASASTVSKVEGMQTGGAWIDLPKQSFGDWAASFHVTPGNLVRFRATWPDATQIVSCWFTHPAGVEQCASPPPPPPPATGVWTHGSIGAIPGGTYDMGIGDADRDGKPELYALGPAGIFRFTNITANSADRTTVVAGCCWGNLVVGDGDRDGKSELYANGFGGLHQFTWTGSAWTDLVIATGPGSEGPLSLGDLDNDGLREIYIGSYGESNTSVWNETVTQVSFAGGAWHVLTVARLVVDPTLPVSASRMWIGDTGDGHSSLVMAESGKPGPAILIANHTAAGWSMSLVGWGDGRGIVAGDVDNDGHGEIAEASGDFLGRVYTFERNGSAWTKAEVAGPAAWLADLSLADGNNDGKQELYFTSSDNHAYQLEKGAAWTVTDMGAASVGGNYAERIIVGDADGTGRNAVYMEVYNTSASSQLGHIERYVWVPATFSATFSLVRGNEWWEQAQVTPSGATLASVSLSLNGGAWQPLTLQSWGVREYAASYHAVQGTVVELRAASSTGASVLSPCYQWIPASGVDATQVACGLPPPPPPPPSGFTATFSGVQGNEWWVQANVAANQALAGVDARVDCGTTWQALTHQSWGGWAASFHVPTGAKVDFRARSTSAAQALSGGYTWPTATTAPAC